MDISWLNLLGISLGLAMDAFAVSIAAGLKLARVTPRHTFRMAFHFGLFQFLMPVVGWALGSQLSGYLHKYDHWAAFGLLVIVGCKMLWEAAEKPIDEKKSVPADARSDPTRGLTLVTLSIATSLDAFAVGVSMALLGVSIWLPGVVIGLITAGLSAIGIKFGGTLGSHWQHRADFAGGCVLILIGLKILIS
jgi:manganese efflux pump family protein